MYLCVFYHDKGNIIIIFKLNNNLVIFQIGALSFIGKFETESGWVKNLATINRINDVSVTRPDPMRTNFHVTLKIKDLQVSYYILLTTYPRLAVHILFVVTKYYVILLYNNI